MLKKKKNKRALYYELQMNIMSQEIQTLRDKVSINLIIQLLFIYLAITSLHMNSSV